MPEGDTVLRTARRLHRRWPGGRWCATELRWPTLGEADLAGRTVIEVVAYGKHILTRIAAADPAAPQPRIPTVPPAPLTLRSHLRMEGRWYVHARDAEPWPARGRAQRAGGARRRRMDRRRHLAGAARPDPDRRRADADRSPRAGHHGRRLRPATARRGRPPADAPTRRAQVGAALLDQTTVAGHRHHVHGRSPVRATGLAVDAGRRGRPAGPAGDRAAAAAPRRHPGRADHHRQSPTRPGHLGARSVRAGRASAAARPSGSRRSGRR